MSEAGLASAERVATRRGAPWWADTLVALLFLALGMSLVVRPYATGRMVPGDLADGRFIFSLLEFFYRTLAATLHGHRADFVDAPFFYPWPRVTNFSETFWGNAEIYALVRALRVGPVASFQAWFAAGFVLTYAAAFVSFRKLGLRTWGAAAGAFLFTFPLPMAAQFGHAQLVYRLWVPPAVLALDWFLTRQSLRAGAACVLFVALQLAAGIYLGLFLCFLLAAYAVALVLVGWHRTVPPGWPALRSACRGELVTAGLMLVAALAVLAVVAISYLEVQAMYGFARSWPDVVDMLPRPGSYLLAGPSQLWPNLSARFPYPLVWEHQIFPGLSAIVPLAWFALSRRARRRHPLAAVLLVAFAILFIITLDLGGHTLYWLIYQLPGFSVLRAVTRIILVMMMPLALLLGMLVDDLAAGGSYRVLRCIVAAALSGLMVAECSLIAPDASPVAGWRGRLAALEAHLPKNLPPHAVLAVKTVPFGAATVWPWMLAQADADVAAATLGVVTLNGYSGNIPPTWKTMTTCRDVGDDLRAGRHFLAEHGLPAPDIAPSRLVLIGFGSCDPVRLARDPTLELGRAYHFAKGAAGNGFAGDGFSFPENWGRWTDGKNAFLFFSLPETPPGPVSIAVDAISLSPPADRRQEATVTANGHDCGRLVVALHQPHAEVTCPAGALHAGDNMLRLRIARPTRPIDLGFSIDRRHLGLGLVRLVVVPSK